MTSSKGLFGAHRDAPATAQSRALRRAELILGFSISPLKVLFVAVEVYSFAQ